MTECRQTPQPKTTSRGRLPAWGRWLIGAGGLVAFSWVVAAIAIAPSAGGTNEAFAATWGMLLLIGQPIAFAWGMAGREDRAPAMPAASRRARVRAEAAHAAHGLAWTLGFAILATATLALFWRHGVGDAGPPIVDAALWWVSWGALWVGVWMGARWSGLSTAIRQVAIGGAAVALVTGVLWLNPMLSRLADEAFRMQAMSAVVWTSPTYGWIEAVLGIDLFRTGGMYHASNGAPHSIIGDYVGSVPHWPTASEMAAVWLGAGVAAATAGWLVWAGGRTLRRLLPGVRQSAERGASDDS